MKLDFKNNFWGYFQFYFSVLGYRIFITIFLSVLVGALDGVGLTMFIPLLQAVEGGITATKHSMGQLHYITDGIQALGFGLTLNTVLVVFVLMFLLKGIIKFLELSYQVKIQHLFMKKVRYALVGSLQDISFRGYLQLDAGKIQNTFISEVQRMSQSVKNYLRWSQALIMLLTYIALATMANYQFAMIVAAAAGVSNLIYSRINKLIKRASIEISKKGHNFNAYLIEAIHYFKYLKSTNYLEKFSKKLREVIDNTEYLNKKTGIYGALTIGIREPMIICIVVAVIFIQVNWMGGSLGSIILSLLLFYRGMNFLMVIQTEWQGFIQNSGAMYTVSEVVKNMRATKEQHGTHPFSRLKKEISIENLSLSFGKTLILNNINIVIPRNKTIALSGVSGSGKTTLVNVISGLIAPDKGQVLLDGKPLYSYNLNSYRSKIGYISQESVVFNDTIFNNISFWAEPTPENIAHFWEVVRLASLEEFIQQQPDKEATRLGDNGILISGGQRQRISIARELYKNPEILILDEATSALDSETERIIQENIEKLQGSYTMIIIAHRLSTIRNVDVIYFLERGHITCSGDFETMLKKSNKFERMVSLQGL